MRNEAISLALCLVLVQGAVDIFSGMSANDKDKPEEQPTTTAQEDLGGEGHFETCVPDAYGEEPIEFDEMLASLSTVGNAIKEIPQPPTMPSLQQSWSRFVNIFQLPRFSEMGQELKAIIDQNRAVIDVYISQWMGFFKKRHRESTASIKGSIKQMNKDIHDSFANHFEEFKDVCLPDSNQCLQSIQKNIQSYEKRLKKNLAACNSFVERQVDQHERWVENERKLLERPFLRVEDCYGEGQVASCVGNMVSSIMKAVTDGMSRFSEAMRNASDSLAERLGKFQECVVDRKRLLDQGQTRIAERAKECLGKQPHGGPGEVFGGEQEDEF